jgi:AcrR family transcriptional regulator
LDVALDLFTEQGYDATSLREVAERLGFTKAALYYHFARKEDILLALHLRLHELGQGVLEQFSAVRADESSLERWAAMFDQFIDQVVDNRRLFLFTMRNQHALEQIQHEEHNRTDHQDMEQQLRTVLANPALPTSLRVRMACSVGAVFGALMQAGDALSDVPPEELAEDVRAAVRDLLALTPAPKRSAEGRRRKETVR